MLTIIGHTGFIGGYLSSLRNPDRCYNSKNIEKMSQETHDLVICSGVSAVKWKANKEPAADMAGIEKLWSVIRRTKARQFVLISTVDIYPNPIDVDETTRPFLTSNHAYGTHRFAFEEMVKSHFENCKIIRLPALFGNGLKKNIIYDMLNNNMTSSINPASSFQWYGLDRLWNDVDVISASDETTFNMSIEPVLTQTIRDKFFPDVAIGAHSDKDSVKYNVKTKNAHVFGASGQYVESSSECLERMDRWLQSELLRKAS